MITVNTTEPAEKLEEEVDGELRLFEEWFKAQGNDPLVRSEKAILKTYFFWKVKGGGNGATTGR